MQAAQYWSNVHKMTDCSYGRSLSQKGKNDAWISCDLDFDSIPEKFYIVLRDGIHAISTDITKQKLQDWLSYIEDHENKVFEDDKK